jgi:hypothetical protein
MDAAFVTAYLFLEGTSQAEMQDTLAKFPLVQAGFLQFTVIPLVGLPAIAQSLHAHNLALPTWWP